MHPNPLLQDWTGPYGLPPFHDVRAEHFEPAFDVAMRQHLAEVEAIATSTEAPTFDNTIAALDRCGRAFSRIAMLFGNLTASATTPELQAIERTLAPRFAGHENAIRLNRALFERIDQVHERRASLGLDAEALRLLERIHLDFVLSGARLAGEARQRYAQLSEELAALCTRFAQNVLADENGWLLRLEGEADLAGLPGSVRSAAGTAARERGLGDAAHAITLSPSLAEPFLACSARRDLREQVWHARTSRGAHAGEHDNRPVAAQIVRLRQELAALHGCRSYADFVLADRMAGSQQAVLDLLRRTWEPALAKAAQDRELLADLARRQGEPTPIAAWDWRYLAEQVRRERFDLDEASLKPYFTLDAMLAAMFDVAGRLFGLQFVEQHGRALYHPDVRIWEVRDRTGTLVGVFLGDSFARPGKRSGAWMSLLRSQSADVLPIVVNNNNFAKATPTLLGLDDVKTLFHEFGHALHGLLSNVRYERLAGTRVLRDFVELPSQLFENWALQPQVLERHARHGQTGEPMPAALLDKLHAARRFDQAWATLQYVGPALIDMALHALPVGTPVDIAQFEAERCAALGVPADIGLRHHLPHFQHLFAGSFYAAGYYVYLWAEVLEADAFNAFLEAGDPFDPTTAQRLLETIYGTGNRLAPQEAFRRFRGRDPVVGPMLEKRGLAPA